MNQVIAQLTQEQLTSFVKKAVRMTRGERAADPDAQPAEEQPAAEHGFLLFRPVAAVGRLGSWR